jgi:hypothetical protein
MVIGVVHAEAAQTVKPSIAARLILPVAVPPPDFENWARRPFRGEFHGPAEMY